MTASFAIQKPCPTLWQFLDLPDEELERVDVAAANLAVAKGLAGFDELETEPSIQKVDDWTERFSRWLPTIEPKFRRTPQNWKNDVNFFRVGMLQGFLGQHIGISYIEEQKDAKSIYYTNPADLFLNGIIDTLRGSCASMAVLHVAISRRMGWPVSLACVKSHLVSRYDDGTTYHNIEATSTKPGTFASDPDEVYIERFKLPKRARACGSDLRKLTAREMLGVFVALRGRHYSDIGRADLADIEYSLSRVLFPNYRNAYLRAMSPMWARGRKLFERGETGHPDSLNEQSFPNVFMASAIPDVYTQDCVNSRP